MKITIKRFKCEKPQQPQIPFVFEKKGNGRVIAGAVAAEEKSICHKN